MQARIIEELNVSPVIDPAEQVRARIDFLKAYLRTSGAAGFVLGISGGQDSTLAGMLCRKAVEELVEEGDEARFVAVRLPYGVQRDEADAQVALAYIRPHHLAVVAAAGQGALHGTVRHSFTRGGTVHIEVDCPEVGSALEVELPAGAPELALVEVGRPIGLAPRSVNVHAAKISSLAA